MSTTGPLEEGPPPRERGDSWWRRQIGAHRVRLIKINDTPHSVALGAAVGMFFGFTPLFGLKTLLSIVVAWLLKSNKIAAAITVTLHDLILPVAPVILLWQYKMGMWVLHGRWPRTKIRGVVLRDYMEWTAFFTLGKPTLIGSLFLAVPSAVIAYFLMRTVVRRGRLASED